MWNASSDVGRYRAGTGWLVRSLAVLYGCSETNLLCRTTGGGKKGGGKKKEGKKKGRLQFSPLLLQWSSSGPQLRCKLRFRMNAVACFHCSLGAIYLSYPIYTMHSGLEHKYTSSYNYAGIFFFPLFPISHTSPDPSNSVEETLISAIFPFSPKAPLISVLRLPNHISRFFHWFSFYPLIWRV